VRSPSRTVQPWRACGLRQRTERFRRRPFGHGPRFPPDRLWRARRPIAGCGV